MSAPSAVVSPSADQVAFHKLPGDLTDITRHGAPRQQVTLPTELVVRESS
ncbi:hypothetical protein JL475_09390 [Streptomyces sp. M2CJ-2]|nr:hypothetical protein [Streptomyces sp. M2CJ-2]MBL3666206.1 hypothetical protein [Streptomyces sp. M2CJ-2]